MLHPARSMTNRSNAAYIDEYDWSWLRLCNGAVLCRDYKLMELTIHPNAPGTKLLEFVRKQELNGCITNIEAPV